MTTAPRESAGDGSGPSATAANARSAVRDRGREPSTGSRRGSATAWSVGPAAAALAAFSNAVQVAGLTAFFAGIAAGSLLVFTDRHGYERPVSVRTVAALVVAGVCLTFAGELGRRLGV